ncbi:MAG: hypothetical protein KDA73_02740 [Rhodobacteraceae bacterium]|nr:hypothetical protein [Paracoccaceae bacterium]
MRPIHFLLPIVALGLAGAAGAGVVTYDYRGLPFGYTTRDSGKSIWKPCGDRPYSDLNALYACSVVPEDGWRGSLAIDLARYPGGSLPGSRLELEVTELPTYAYSITTANGSHYRGVTDQGWSQFRFLTFSGHVQEFLDWTAFEGHFAWTFDAAGRISSWQGTNYAGGSNDPDTARTPEGRGIDAYASGAVTQGPGAWTRDPPAVPLPAAGFGLVGALGLLGIVRAWRIRRETA